MACCKSVWYCTPDGPVEVDFTGDPPTAEPPEGWDGHPPYLTEEDAEAACPTPEIPGTVPTECCDPILLPAIIHITFGGSFAPLGSVELTAAGDTQPWTGSVAGCGGTVNIEITCNPPNWTVLLFGSINIIGSAGAEVSCDPFLVEGGGMQPTGDCAGAYTITITS